MFDRTTKTYTNADHAGSYDWIVEGIDPSPLTQDEAAEWAEQVIAGTLESDMYGHNGEPCSDEKIKEIVADLGEEKEEIISYLMEWATK